jgi:2-polyprenyl-3-methyl-5-hydroxy-6-metoxy-1,4-benzoquinol methylase
MMNLSALLHRERPILWGDHSKLPWNDPAFSSRMLHEHLSQEQGRASRPLDQIDRHVAWIHDTALRGRPSRILDLGCGPGLYTARLAQLGHTCTGIDFSPASIAFATAEAERQGFACNYLLQDLRDGDFGREFQAVLLLFGEFNAFSPAEARELLATAWNALAPTGVLVLEVHGEDYVRDLGSQPCTWFSAHRGLFSDRSHLCLREYTWHADFCAAVERFFVVEIETTEVRTFTSTTQAYSGSAYVTLLRDAGFLPPERYPSLDGAADNHEFGLFVLVARKAAV